MAEETKETKKIIPESKKKHKKKHKKKKVLLKVSVVFLLLVVIGWFTFGANVGQYMIVGLVGANFIFELLFNVVLSPVVVRLIRIGKKEVE